MSSYDRREAASILGCWKEQKYPSGGRLAAAKDLLREFEELWRECRLEAVRNSIDDGLMLLDRDQHGLSPAVFIEIDEPGQIAVTRISTNPANPSAPFKGSAAKLRLDFDPVQKILISPEIDADLTPKSGELKPRRSPLAVLTEAVTRALNSPAPRA